ncbi:uncharacterized protein LOC121750627 [Salvia splendens]|uniref:uncharacterized protein LOC121750627 n=1 Tax=Salvia splendens TaxID=180675 RepID=UPI001C27DF94|nr:uncharacterized protein LOC121750627 [Salvia splendens]
MLFSHGDAYSLYVLGEAVKEFSACSGLEVNQGKSNIFLAGTMTDEQREHLINIFGFTVAHLPVKYLGIPLASRMLKMADYSQLIEKFSTTVKKWNGKSLFFAGRLELIRACLQGVDAYWLQAFPIVATVTSRLTAIARQFLWGSKFSKVAWKDICLPTIEGGLGLRDLDNWKTTLYAKILWNIFGKKDTLWIQWVHTEIIRGTDFWEWKPRPKNNSPLIKHLISIRDEMGEKVPKQEVERLLTQWSWGRGTQAAYDWFRTHGERRFWAKFVWKDLIPPKHSFICWLALRERLTTRDRVTWTATEKSCAFCTTQDETNEHLFFKCPETTKVWEEI